MYCICHLRVCARRAATNAWLRRSLTVNGSGSQTGSGGIGRKTGGLWHWKKSQVEVESEGESEWSGLGGRRDQDWRQESPPPCGDPRASEGAECAAEKDSPKVRWRLGTSKRRLKILL